MRDVWDVAVVGAGPAGAAAARAAAATGARVLLLEKAELPRYKRCGGGLIGPSQAALAGLDVPVRQAAGRFTFTLQGRRRFTRTAEPFLPMVLRSELDLRLTEQAVAAGAQLRTGVTVGAYAEEDGVVTLGTSTGPVWARSVVAADGSASRAAAYVGVQCDQVDLGLECELPTPAGSDWDGHVLLDWGPVPGSYGWVFPKGDAGEPLRDYYRSFVASLGLDLATAVHDGGHLTRVRAPGSPLQRGQVLVAGDAAGLLGAVDPRGHLLRPAVGPPRRPRRRRAGRLRRCRRGRAGRRGRGRPPGADGLHEATGGGARRDAPAAGDVAAVRRPGERPDHDGRAAHPPPGGPAGQGLRSSSLIASPCSPSRGAAGRTPGSGQADSFSG